MAEKPDISSCDFSQNPFIVIWEMTRSCALKCVHCRAEAVDVRSPDELTTSQAFSLLEEIRRFGRPLVVFTGGDPLRRPDALSLIKYGSDLGLRMTMTPSGTPEVTYEILQKLKQNGLARLAVSLDGSTAAIHDSFRKVEGSFAWTMNIIRWANEIGLPVQINTTITRYNLNDLEAFGRLLQSMPIVLWSVFFLVPVGRGHLEDEISGREYEKVFNWMADLSEKSSFDIKSTEAPHYRRVLIQRKQRASARALTESTESVVSELRHGSFAWQKAPSADGVGRSTQGVNDGNGFVFISHTGEIQPSGFLPLSGGNVKKHSLVDVYRNSELFRRLRDASQLEGKCGVCEYKTVCGGSRARSYGVYGNYMAPEPFCVYVPKGYSIKTEEKMFWSTKA